MSQIQMSAPRGKSKDNKSDQTYGQPPLSGTCMMISRNAWPRLTHQIFVIDLFY